MSIAGSFAKACNVSPSSIDQALASLTEKSAPNPQRWRYGPIDFGCCNDASFEHRKRGGIDFAVAVWGRLDNRAELESRLAATAASDAGLLLCAYLRWGTDFLDRVVGDFCCALWDGSQGRLLLGRDFIGRRPLVYHDSVQALHFAAEPRGLLAISGIEKEIDEDSLAKWFAIQPRPENRTFYKGIQRVPPGHVLIADGEGLRLHRYWRPEERPILRLRRDEDYAEALLAALEEAVSCRLPAEGMVATALSAGLDSSTVTALAARQLARQGRRLTAFTAVPQAGFDAGGYYPNRVCDEGPLAAKVAHLYPNIDHVLIPNNAAPLLGAIEKGVRFTESPLLGGVNVTWFDSMFEGAQQRGATAFLTGQAGNFTSSYDGISLLSSLLARWRFLALGKELSYLHKAGSSWRSLAMDTARPFLPSSLRNGIRRAFGKESIESIYDIGCINPRFARESGMEERYYRQGFDRGPAYKTTDSRCRRLIRLGMLDSGIATAGMWRRHGFYSSDPTADRRVVELCLAIPDEQYLRRGESRSLVRRAMSGILPPELLANRRIGLQSADWGMTLLAALPGMRTELDRLEASPLAQRYLDLPRMRLLMEKLPEVDWGSNKARVNYSGLVRSLAAGVFIRQVEDGNT